MSKVAQFTYDRCGVGNRIFQYVYARLWCEDNGYQLSHTGIPELNIPSDDFGAGENIHKPQRFLQDYNLYSDYLNRIKSWECFDKVEDVNEDDLVIHLRAGNRFLAKNALYSATANVLENALSKIKFNKLHIVTNLKKHDRWTAGDIQDAMDYLKEHGGDGEPPEVYRSTYPFLSVDESLEYTNSFIDLFAKYDVAWVSGSIQEDFNYMRKFKKILFPRSTFSWWAAATGVADEVYVYGPWAPHKAKSKGSLGETNYKGWKTWG